MSARESFYGSIQIGIFWEHRLILVDLWAGQLPAEQQRVQNC